MPKIYLAKVNLNSNIFSVYSDQVDIKVVLKEVYNKINIEEKYIISKQGVYSDASGNRKTYRKKSEYSFAEIRKKDMIVTGMLLRKFTKPNEEVNTYTDKVETIIKEESVGIRYYFDVNKEMVTFCERQCFWYNQFTNAFNELLNRCVKGYEFETFLQKDKNKLEEKIRELHKITRVRAVLIPPNPNAKSISTIKERCMSTNSTKLTCVFESDDMKMDSEEMLEIRDYVAAGYGDLTASGLNENGREQRVSSSLDAAYCEDIADNLDEDGFNEEAKKTIINFEQRCKSRKNV